MKTASFKYDLLTYRRDQLWFPLVLWGLFAIIILIVSRAGQDFDIVRAYLVTVPLVGGIMAAYAILDDPVLELRFATPVRALQLIVQGAVVTFLIQAIGALSFITFGIFLGVDFSVLGDWSAIHLSWVIPTITLIGLGIFGALLGAHPTAGSFLVGLVWLMEIIIRDGMLINNWKYFFIFMGIFRPENPDLGWNQMTLMITTLLCLSIGWLLLHRQERYI